VAASAFRSLPTDTKGLVDTNVQVPCFTDRSQMALRPAETEFRVSAPSVPANSIRGP
jgi:hypothetical protein